MSSLTDSAKKSLGSLTPGERVRFFIWSAILGLTTLLDIAGIGLLTAGVSVLSSSITGNSSSAFKVPFVSGLIPQKLTEAPNFLLYLTSVVIVFFILKALASTILISLNNQWIARVEVEHSIRMAKEVFVKVGAGFRKTSESVDEPYALTFGTTAYFSRSLSAMSTIVSECISASALLLVLLATNPIITLIAVCYFGILAAILMRLVGGRMALLGEKNTQGLLLARRTLVDYKATSAESFLAGKSGFFINRYAGAKKSAVHSLASAITLGLIPRYVVELGLVIGTFALAAYEFRTGTTSNAAVTIAVFLATGFRITPSLLTLINNMSTLRQLGEDIRTVEKLGVAP